MKLISTLFPKLFLLIIRFFFIYGYLKYTGSTLLGMAGFH
jgi:hypothetical protein